MNELDIANEIQFLLPKKKKNQLQFGKP